jgi:hypothetical protein
VVPAIYDTGFKSGQPLSDINLEDGSFVRLQNVTLGYDFGSAAEGRHQPALHPGRPEPAAAEPATPASTPERATGIDNNFYPLPRTITAGLNLGF